LLVCATADQRKFAQHWINVTFLEFAIPPPETVPTPISVMASFAMMEMLAPNWILARTVFASESDPSFARQEPTVKNLVYATLATASAPTIINVTAPLATMEMLALLPTPALMESASALTQLSAQLLINVTLQESVIPQVELVPTPTNPMVPLAMMETLALLEILVKQESAQEPLSNVQSLTNVTTLELAIPIPEYAPIPPRPMARLVPMAIAVLNPMFAPLGCVLRDLKCVVEPPTVDAVLA